MVIKANTSQAQSFLTLMQNVAPVTYNLLHRPVVGQGGYQSRLRNIQTELGIVPAIGADSTTPAARQTFHGISANADEAPIHVATSDVGRDAQVLAAARSLKALGKVEQAAQLISELINGLPAVQAQGISTTAVDQDEEIDSEADLTATLDKARKVREEKAILRANGRQRRSPKLSVASKMARTYRMFALHHGDKGAAQRMRAKFGADWKARMKG